MLNATITTGTVNFLAYRDQTGSGGFTPNNAFDTFMSQFRAASPHPTLGNPMQAGANDTLSPQWCGNQSYSDFCVIYQNTNPFYEPQNMSTNKGVHGTCAWRLREHRHACLPQPLGDWRMRGANVPRSATRLPSSITTSTTNPTIRL